MSAVIDLLDDRGIPTWPRRGPLVLRLASGVVMLAALALTVTTMAQQRGLILGESTVARQGESLAGTAVAAPSLSVSTLTAALLAVEARIARAADEDVRVLRSLQVESRQGGGTTRELSFRLESPRASPGAVEEVLAVLVDAGVSDARIVRTSPTPLGELVELFATADVAGGAHSNPIAPAPGVRRLRDGRLDDPLLELVAIVADHGLRLTTARVVRGARGGALVVEASGESGGLRALLQDLEQNFSAPTRIQRFVLTAAATPNTFDVLLVLTPREAPTGGSRDGGTRR